MNRVRNRSLNTYYIFTVDFKSLNLKTQIIEEQRVVSQNVLNVCL